MIVRIINEIEYTDNFYDCVTSGVYPIRCPETEEISRQEFEMILHFGPHKGDFTFPLSKNDEIFYLNDSGKTIAIDRRMCKKI